MAWSTDHIPGLFTNLYTAPPAETIYDMYFNDVSFDEAMEKSLAVDPFNDFGMEDLDSGSLADEILGRNDNAIEIAAYQLRMADEHGVDPADVLNTPYGLQTGLPPEELDVLLEVYPGLSSVDLYDIEGSFGQADQILNAAGPNIENLVDTVDQLTEDNNAIGTEQTFLDTAAERLGNYFQYIQESATGGSPFLAGAPVGGFGSGSDDDDVIHAGFGLGEDVLKLIAEGTDAAANTLTQPADDTEVSNLYAMESSDPELYKLFYSDKSERLRSHI